MLILDTDHLSELNRRSEIGLALAVRLRQQADPVVVTIVTIEEQARGLLASLKKERDPRALLRSYQNLHDLMELARFRPILPWSEAAIDVLEHLAQRRLRIGTMDLRIAAIALANDATLLSRNLKDFARVPGLRVENWLET